MNILLTPDEARVIGCLIEKEITTPEQYPLSINALTNACNQRSNRHPVLDMDEATVQQLVDDLIRKYLVREHVGYGSRVKKFQHRFCNSNFGNLKFSAEELGVVCELLLRGPQTPGELRSHAGGRLCQFGDVTEVETVLHQLAQREDGPFVVRLPREPGKRESRYAHLFGGEVAGAEADAAGPDEKHPAADGRPPRLEQRVQALEEAVAALQARLAALEAG